ncbi:7716_t:CDS:1 [Paraglomus occultum]|uniref:7716_t:CDS:1 n=1 Tax=Paraglomus occultum TaxID=144539 RepID=A0A9N8W762_9GLOM|nr:7716_t:CDS:1 [Paraglomus occultum]
MADSIINNVTNPSKSRSLLGDAPAKIMEQLELAKYARDSGMFADCVNALEGMLRSFFQTQEDYSKRLEIQLAVQQHRCMELNEKWKSAENQSRMHKNYLDETRKSLSETKKNHDEIIIDELREKIQQYEREIEKFDERYAQQVQINERNQQIIHHYKCKYDYGIDPDSEVISLRQRILALEKQLSEFRNATAKIKIHAEKLEVSFRHELQEMQQRYKDAEAREAAIQKKYVLLKDDITKMSIQNGNEEVKELSAGPSCTNPLTELELEISVLRGQKVELEKQLYEAQNAAGKEKIGIERKSTDAEVRTAELLRRSSLFKDGTAIDDTTNVKQDDNDEDLLPLQLTVNIFKLQDSLKELTHIKGRYVVLDAQGITALLQKYNCQTDFISKPIVSSALQRHIIESVLQATDIYFNEYLDAKNNSIWEQYTETDLDHLLEMIILNTTLNLNRYIRKLIEKRKGNDESTCMAEARIDQQVYAVLDDRGFASVDHPLVEHLVLSVLTDLDKYRQLQDETRKKDIEKLIFPIIREIIRIFYFSYRTQVPYVEYHFFERGEMFDPAIMERLDDDGEEPGMLVVEICSFPLIGVNINDERKRQVFNKAQVRVRSS